MLHSLKEKKKIKIRTSEKLVIYSVFSALYTDRKLKKNNSFSYIKNSKSTH